MGSRDRMPLWDHFTMIPTLTYSGNVKYCTCNYCNPSKQTAADVREALQAALAAKAGEGRRAAKAQGFIIGGANEPGRHLRNDCNTVRETSNSMLKSILQKRKRSSAIQRWCCTSAGEMSLALDRQDMYQRQVRMQDVQR